MKIKVCGMKFPENISQIAELEPDYLGFIFFDKSTRFFDCTSIITIPSKIKKVGVFVDAAISEVKKHVLSFNLNIVQLHGNENPDYCKKIKQELPDIELWKAFPIHDQFNFNDLKNYSVSDKFLFDTKGKHHGGNGTKFNWEILNNYKSEKKFILSGGIDLKDFPSIQRIKQEFNNLDIIDINSRFEIVPGMKNTEKTKEFIQKIKQI